MQGSVGVDDDECSNDFRQSSPRTKFNRPNLLLHWLSSTRTDFFFCVRINRSQGNARHVHAVHRQTLPSSLVCPQSTRKSTTPSPATPWLLASLAAVAVVADSSGGDGMTHLHLYIHETLTGANATAITVATGSALRGRDASFGSMRAAADELREGSDAASQLLGRAEGMLVQADLGSPAAWCTVVNLVFTEGDYRGSTLVVNGRADDPAGGGVVGGTGRFRRARGYSLMTKFGNPTPSTVVFEMDLYVNVAL